jgi:hypothetical protein
MAVVADRRVAGWWRSVVAPSAADSVRTWRRRGAGDGAGGGLDMEQEAVDVVPRTPAARRPPQSPAAALAAGHDAQCSRSPAAPRLHRRNSRTASTHTI